MHWVDYCECPPEPGKWLIVTNGQDVHVAVHIDEMGFVGPQGECMQGRVTHWMPLPDPPQSTLRR